ncbi:hypothetical protein M3212_15015 [Alkalihalobacillus oceani]|uniref:hypothetical protein n=1 Tax=Halalkalibacter oceani TaxID=1653776 RepID=UPI00203F843E|nr:hypothetical protein [Halalkalibacter oceani]MCM3762084.1 hypothetical protein [Halalkalibacter oceani]
MEINALNTDFIYNQDGFGFSGLIPARPLGPEIEITGYQDWPTDFTKGNYAFTAGVYDGENIWMIPFNADQVMRVNRTTGQMTGFDDWPSDFQIEPDIFFLGSFKGAVFDGENIWMIPYNANQLVKLDTIL